MQPEDITVEQILDAAIERLQRNGWIQNNPGSSNTANCLTGALYWGVWDLAVESVRQGIFCPSLVPAHEQVAKLLGLSDIGGLTGWNDYPGRTVEDVILALKETRYELEARHED